MTNLDVHLPAIAAGDTRAFAMWMAHAEHPLRASLRSFAGQVDVEAVLQEALLRVWQVAPRFEPDGKDNGLLRLGHRIARNLCISEVRKRRGAPVALSEEELELDAQPSDPLLRKTLAMCHEKLPTQPARALRARIEAQGNERDIDTASRLQMTKNTFLQNLTRARKLLAECLKKNGIELTLTKART